MFIIRCKIWLSLLLLKESEMGEEDSLIKGSLAVLERKNKGRLLPPA